jgi:hypothetical protein
MRYQLHRSHVGWIVLAAVATTASTAIARALPLDDAELRTIAGNPASYMKGATRSR